MPWIDRTSWNVLRRQRAQAKAARRQSRDLRRKARDDWDRLQQTRLRKAAGIATVELVCHRDMWVWLQQMLGEIPLQVPPGPILRCSLSGITVVQILETMEEAATALRYSARDRALAHRLYQAVADIVDRIDPHTESRDPLPDIVLDDRTAASITDEA